MNWGQPRSRLSLLLSFTESPKMLAAPSEVLVRLDPLSMWFGWHLGLQSFCPEQFFQPPEWSCPSVLPSFSSLFSPSWPAWRDIWELSLEGRLSWFLFKLCLCCPVCFCPCLQFQTHLLTCCHCVIPSSAPHYIYCSHSFSFILDTRLWCCSCLFLFLLLPVPAGFNLIWTAFPLWSVSLSVGFWALKLFPFNLSVVFVPGSPALPHITQEVNSVQTANQPFLDFFSSSINQKHSCV